MKTFKLLFTALLLLCCVAANAIDVKVDSIYYSVTSFSSKTVKVVSGENRYTGDVVIPDSVAIHVSNDYFALEDWKSEEIADNTVSSRVYVLDVTAGGVLEFDWKVSSESYDKLTVKLNGKNILEKSGTRQGDHSYTFSDDGVYELVVQYAKNSSGSSGDDCAEVYNFSLSGNNHTGTDGEEYLFTVTAVAESAFADCDSLTSITIPASVLSVGNYAFDNCTSLKNLYFEDGDSCLSLGYNNYSTDNYAQGLFYDCPLDTLYLGRTLNYNAGNWYGYSPFGYNATLRTAVISDCVMNVERFLFYNCTNLESVIIGNGVKVIEYDMFHNCSSLANLKLGTGVTSIDQAFSGCSGLTSLELPENLINLEESALKGTNIIALELPASLTQIGYDAFPSSLLRLTCNTATPPTLLSSTSGSSSGLGNISIVYVPAGCSAAYKAVYPWSSKVIVDGSGVAVNVTVTPGMLGEEILKQTGYLSDVNYLTVSGSVNDVDINNIKNSMPNLLTIDMSGLDMKEVPVGMFIDRKAILSVILPSVVETIGGGAFCGCVNIESIVLPEGLKSLCYEHYIDGKYDVGAFKSCTSLKSISLPSTLERIEDYSFSNCTALRKVTFNKGLKYIGYSAFYYCTALREVTFNKGLEYIGNNAFYYCTALKSIVLPETLDNLPYGVFYGCSSLENIVLNGVKSIGFSSSSYSGAFENCTSLKTVEIPEGVTFVGTRTFKGCTNITEVSLPSTLASCGETPFGGCNKLSSVTCKALIPPTLASGLLTLEDMGLPLQRTLNVPEWTLNQYKLTSGWAAFSQIVSIPNFNPSSINVTNDAVLTLPTAGLPANYKPDMNIGLKSDTLASLHLKGSGTFTLGNYAQYINSQLLNEVCMTADSVQVKMYLEKYRSSTGWKFLSFPFDVKVSDIVTNCDWVIRKYDGEARAKGDLNNTWVTVPYDSVLQAGQGYIWSCSGGSFIIPAMNNDNKNMIFADTTRNVPLTEYASEYISNSSWNLVGNPYPCYYDTHMMNYTAPITVWENNTYAAYSPVDDDYILKPFEAFFVQCPENVKSIAFESDGRQLSAPASAPSTAPSHTRSESVTRCYKHYIG